MCHLIASNCILPCSAVQCSVAHHTSVDCCVFSTVLCNTNWYYQGAGEEMEERSLIALENINTLVIFLLHFSSLLATSHFIWIPFLSSSITPLHPSLLHIFSSSYSCSLFFVFFFFCCWYYYNYFLTLSSLSLMLLMMIMMMMIMTMMMMITMMMVIS